MHLISLSKKDIQTQAEWNQKVQILYMSRFEFANSLAGTTASRVDICTCTYLCGGRINRKDALIKVDKYVIMRWKQKTKNSLHANFKTLIELIFCFKWLRRRSELTPQSFKSIKADTCKGRSATAEPRLQSEHEWDKSKVKWLWGGGRKKAQRKREGEQLERGPRESVGLDRKRGRYSKKRSEWTVEWTTIH